MRRLAVFMHTSLEGFVAGPDGEMDWITVTDDVFALAGERTDAADVALYGRKTFEMMDSYWPTAGQSPTASAHDLAHSRWYNQVRKVVVSRSLSGAAPANAEVIGRDLVAQVGALKADGTGDIVVFGSASTVHALIAARLVDDYWLMINPVLLGGGVPLFPSGIPRIPLVCASITRLGSGVVATHFTAV